MTFAGWCILILSWGSIVVLAAFSLWRTIRTQPQELSAPLELEAEIDEMEIKKDRSEEEEA